MRTEPKPSTSSDNSKNSLAIDCHSANSRSMITPRSTRLRASWFSISILILALGAMRLVHLEADTPRQVTRYSVGVFVDEGYKTLSPRNLALYGEVRWNLADQYEGWMDNSPITQWLIFIAFRAFGVELGSARLVVIGWFVIFLIGFAAALRNRYQPLLLLLGIVALGTTHLLFFFSRIALFEIPICVGLYSGLFVLRRYGRRFPFWSLAAVVALSVGTALFIKLSAALYAAAILVGLGMGALTRKSVPKSVLLRFGLPAAVIFGWLAVITFEEWSSRISADPGEILISNYLNPLSYSTGFLVCTGLFCLIQALSTDFRRFLRNPYRAGLLGLAVFGPILLSLFQYHPTRYYVPLLPAYVLLILEWIHLTYWKRPTVGRIPLIVSFVGLILTSLLMFLVFQGVNYHLLFHLPLDLGDSPGLTERFIRDWFFTLLLPTVLLLGGTLWAFRNVILRPRSTLLIFSLLMTLMLLRDAVMLGSFYLVPSYQSREIAGDIERVVPVEGSIAGDWAPFLTLGTPIRTIYMFRKVNPPSHLVELRPSHFLFSDTPTSNEHMKLFEKETRLRLGEPLYRSKYVGRRVVLYPIVFDDS